MSFHHRVTQSFTEFNQFEIKRIELRETLCYSVVKTHYYTVMSKKAPGCHTLIHPEALYYRVTCTLRKILFLRNAEPVYICPTTVIGSNCRTSTESTYLDTDPCSFFSLE